MPSFASSAIGRSAFSSLFSPLLRYGSNAPLEGVGVAFSPIDLGDSLLAWWSADRTDLMTLSGAQVTSWRDAKNGYDVVQAVAGARPLYSATSFNGAPGLSFDGTDDALVLASQPFPIGANPSEIWAVLSQDDVSATARVSVGYGSISSASRRLGKSKVDGVNTRGDVVIGGGTSFTGTTVEVSGRLVHRGQIGATQSTQTINGTADGSVTAVPGGDTTRVVLGASPGGVAGTSFWLGQLRDIIVTGSLTAEQIAKLQAWALPRRML